MRILLFFLITLYFNKPVLSQEYIPMLQQDNSWGVDFWGSNFNGSFNVQSFKVIISGEQDIEGVIYKEISPFGCLWREENGIIYEFVEDGEERIVIDFTLEVGDVFEIEYDLCYSYRSFYYDLVVTAVYEDFIAGEVRKVIEFSDYGELWIEGIGSTEGIAPGAEDPDSGNYLVCFEKNNETTFFNGATMCNNTFLSIEENRKPQLKLFPNPVTYISTLQLPETLSNGIIRYYNVTGKLLKEEVLLSNEVQIKRNDLNAGIYLYQILNGGIVQYANKFLVK